MSWISLQPDGSNSRVELPPRNEMVQLQCYCPKLLKSMICAGIYKGARQQIDHTGTEQTVHDFQVITRYRPIVPTDWKSLDVDPITEAALLRLKLPEIRSAKHSAENGKDRGNRKQRYLQMTNTHKVSKQGQFLLPPSNSKRS